MLIYLWMMLIEFVKLFYVKYLIDDGIGEGIKGSGDNDKNYD
jgi:hypothetical protein